MALRFYIVPMLASGSGLQAINAPAYIALAGGQVIRTINYGAEGVALVLADVTPAQNTTIAANVDAIVIPANIDNLITVIALPLVQTALESINIPADWITTAMSYRDVLKIIGGLFFFAQRYYGQNELNLFRGGVTMSTQFNALPAQERQRLLDCANSFNYDISSLSGTSTIRQILRALAVQWTQGVIDANEVTF